MKTSFLVLFSVLSCAICLSNGQEIARHGLPIAQYQKFFNHLVSRKYAPHWIDVSNYRGKAYVNIVARPANSKYYAFHGLSSSSYQHVFNTYTAMGYQPEMIDSYLYNGHVRYAGYFKKVSGPAYYAYHGLTQASHQATFNALTKVGYVPTCISVISDSGTRKWTAIYKKINVGSFFVKSAIKVSDYQALFNDQLSKGRRPAYLNGYNYNGVAYLSVIFTSKTPSGYWRHGLTSSGYQSVYNQQTGTYKRGTRMVTAYEHSGFRYAAGWWN